MFHSTLQESPGEWTDPQLAKQFELLRSIISISNRALEKSRVAKQIRSSLEARVTIHTNSEEIMSTLCSLAELQSTENSIEFSLADFLIVSEVSMATMQDAVFGGGENEEGVVRWCGEQEEKDFAVQVMATPISGRGKCPRCWKWVCPEEKEGTEELCERCRMAEDASETNVIETRA